MSMNAFDADEPMCTEQTLTIMGGALVEAPCYEKHARGKNWMAKIHPNATAPGGWDRAFAPMARGKDLLYIVQDVFPGDVLEFAADYVTSLGKRHTQRVYACVMSRDEEALRIAKFASPVQAWQARELFTQRSAPPLADDITKTPPSKDPPGIAELKDLNQRLQQLLADPHPGLTTWRELVKRVCHDIGEFG